MSLPLTLLLAIQVAQAGVSGTVRDEMSGDPLAYAVVELPDLERRVLTDEHGRFSVAGLPPGPHHLSITRQGFGARTLHALVPRDGIVVLNVALRPVPVRLDGLVVEPRLAIRGVEHPPADETSVDAISLAAIKNHPMIAEADAFLVLEGGDVAVLPESQGGLHVRGGAAGHTAFELDGIPVLGPTHAAGVFSAWNPDALSSVRLNTTSSGLVPSLSGTVVGVTRSAGVTSRASTAISTTQARLSADGPLGRGGGGYVLSWRAGFPTGATRPTDPAKIRGETGDLLAKVELALLGGEVTLLGYSSENELDAGAVADAPSGSTPTARNGFEWKSQSLGATWRRDAGTGALEVRVWDARGAGTATLRPPADAPHVVDNRRTERGAAADFVHEGSRGGRLHVGARVGRGATRYAVGSAEPFGMEDGLTTGSLLLGYRTPRFWESVIRAEVDAGASSLGVRVSPTLSATRSLGPRLSASASVSRRHQLVQSLRNEESLLGAVFPADLFVVAGRDGVPVGRADQARIGVDYRPVPGLAIRGQGYLRRLTSVVFVASRTGSLFSTGGYDVGSTDVRGFSVEAAMSGSRYGIVTSYTGQAVRNRSPGGSYVPSYAPAHRAQVGTVLHATPTLSLRIAHSGVWGRHATALVGPVEWESCNVLDGGCELAGAPDHDAALGAARPGSYHRTDIGVRKHWHVGVAGRDAMLAMYGTVTNVLSRENVLNFAFDPATGESAPIDMLPLTPLVIGLELTF